MINPLKFGISCHTLNPILINSNYIYPKINKKSKRQPPAKGFALIENNILEF